MSGHRVHWARSVNDGVRAETAGGPDGQAGRADRQGRGPALKGRQDRQRAARRVRPSREHLKKIREAKAALEAEARAGAIEKGKDPDDTVPPDKAQRDFTDPDSTIPKTTGGYIQRYNAQVAVDDTFQVIISQHLTRTAPDVNELVPAIESITKKLNRKPKAVWGAAAAGEGQAAGRPARRWRASWRR